jgi:hypothetical protein
VRNLAVFAENNLCALRGVGVPMQPGGEKHFPPARYVSPRLKTEIFLAAKLTVRQHVSRVHGVLPDLDPQQPDRRKPNVEGA